MEHPYSHLTDLANTLVNWLEYTQLIKREDGRIYLLEDRVDEVHDILSNPTPMIDRPEQQEYFQRKYGVDTHHRKDNRDLTKSLTITPRIIARQKVMQAYITESLNRPITRITNELVDYIMLNTGIDGKTVEEILVETYPHGSIGSFMTKYFEMAFKGRDEATEFEKATAELFQDVFGYETKHVGPIGLTPDVLLVSRDSKYQAIIDNKAYSTYTISNDHHNRMVHNYLSNINRYSQEKYPMAFFTYIAGGFGKSVDKQIASIYEETGVRGSVISVTNVIKMVEQNQITKYTHEKLNEMFGMNRQILMSDL